MIYTGRFAELESYKSRGLVPISIAGYVPEHYEGIQFKTLAPKYSWWKEWHDQKLSNDWYRAKYKETVLDKLNPKVIANRLRAFGENIILLCYEKPGEFCHRQLVAEWLRGSGIAVQEYQIQSSLLNRSR